MTRHLDALELDEAAAGQGEADARAHLSSCSGCRGALASASAERQEIVAQARFASTLVSLPGPRSRVRWAWALVPALAAGLALVVFARAPAELRSKGASSLQLVAADGAAATVPRAGEVVELRAAPGPHRFALVVFADTGAVLWPQSAAQSGALAPGQHLSLSLRLTPGPLRLVAAFSDRALTAPEALAAPRDAEVRRLEFEVAP